MRSTTAYCLLSFVIAAVGVVLSAKGFASPTEESAPGYAAVERTLTPTCENLSGAAGRDSVIDTLFENANTLLKQNKPLDASLLLEKALSLKPDSAAIHCNLGLAYQQQSKFQQALVQFEAALKLSPDSPEAILNMAGVYQSQGELRKALERYQEYLQKCPQSKDALLARSSIEAIKIQQLRRGTAGEMEYFGDSHQRNRWKPNAKIRVFIETTSLAAGFKSSFPDVLRESFEEWLESSGNKISVRFVDNERSADITCAWTASARSGLTENERGSTRLVARRGIIEHAEVTISTLPVLESGELSDAQMKKACLHELGHVFGLSGHSRDNKDVMYFTVDSATVPTSLTERDKSALFELYRDFPARRTGKLW